MNTFIDTELELPMVKYSSGHRITAGVPLGGIGAGKVEVDNRGKMVNLTIANAWAFPLPQMRGFHVFVKPEEGRPLFLEKEIPIKGFFQYEPEEMEYEGRYPFAWLNARSKGVEVRAEFFLAIVPGNLRDSSLPAFGLAVKVKGSRKGLIAVSASNVLGAGLPVHQNPVGRRNERLGEGVRFLNAKALDSDPAKGDVSLISPSPSLIVTQYNLNVRPKIPISERSWKGTYESEEPWGTLIGGGSPKEDVHEVTGLWDDPAGLVASEYR